MKEYVVVPPAVRASAAACSERALAAPEAASAARPPSSGQATRAARSSARPCRRDAARCAGDGVLASASASISPQKSDPSPGTTRWSPFPGAEPRSIGRSGPGTAATSVSAVVADSVRPARMHAAAASPAATSPAVRSRPRRNASSEARSLTVPAVTAGSTPPECACPPAGNRESDRSSAGMLTRPAGMSRGRARSAPGPIRAVGHSATSPLAPCPIALNLLARLATAPWVDERGRPPH